MTGTRGARPVLIAHADGDEKFAERLAGPIRAAGFEVVHRGTVLVGESLMQEATRVLTAGGPVVLCGTIRAMGTVWAQHVVNAARAFSDVRIFGVQIERDANLKYLTFDAEVAPFWLDPDRAVHELVAALTKHYPVNAGPSSAPPDSDSTVQQRFRDLLLSACDIIDLANLPADRHLATRQLALRSLFVPLKVRVEREAGLDINPDELVALERRRSAADLQKTAHLLSSVRGGSVLAPAGLRLRHARRLVILGDPGAGKTTLLRWMATAYLLRLRSDPDWSALPAVDTLPDEDWLPILIRCRDLGPDQVAGSLEDMLVHVLRRSELATADIDVLKRLVTQRLDHGTALLLFDGLDEITDPGARSRFCRQLEQVHLARPDAPIVATSRIVGYREMGYRIGRGFEHLTIAELGRSDKDDFIRRWCAVTEPPSRQKTAAAEIITDIHGTDRIERLTSNPMLLTTMALVKRKVGKLPEHRGDLYREAVQVLLNWRAEVDLPVDYHEAVPQLEYLAYAMSERGVQQLTDDEIVALLDRMRAEYPNVHAIHRRPAADFIRLMERRTGILVESGQVRQPGRLAPIFEFRHLTFQEYLTALALVEGRYPGRDRTNSLADDVGRLAARVGGSSGEAELSMADSGRETIRLCVTICNDDDVDSVLKAVLGEGCGTDVDATGAARSRAVLAALCLEDEPNAHDSTVDDIVDKLVANLRPDDDTSNAPTALQALARSRWAPRLHRRLARELRSRGERAVPHLGRLWGQTLVESAPKDDADRALWESGHVAALDSANADTVLQAALAIGYLAQVNRLTALSGAHVQLLDLITSDDTVLGGAAAWALAEMRRAVSPSGWYPRNADVDRIEAAMDLPGIDPTRVMSLMTAADPRRRSTHIGLLTAAAGDQDPLVRATAVVLLGQTSHEVAVVPLVARLDDPELKVRTAAASALGALQSSSCVAPLLARLQDPESDVREAVAQALGDLGDKRAVTPLLSALDDSNAAVRAQAATALGALGEGRAVGELVTRLDRFDPKDMWKVMRALGQLGDGRAVEPLCDRFDDESDLVRTWIASALDDLCDQRSYESLTAGLTDADPSVRGWVARALGSLGDTRAFGSVAALLADADPGVRQQSASALAAFGDGEAATLVTAALSDPEPGVRGRAATALGQLADARTAVPLTSALHDTDTQVRAEAAEAVGKLYDAQSLDLLLAALRDPHPYLRSRAAIALGRLGDIRAAGTLVTALEDPVAEVREEAVYALGSIHDNSRLPAVRRCLTDPDATVRANAFGALGLLGDRRSLAAIVRGLDSASLREREWAAFGLGQLGDDRAVEPLLARLDDPCPYTRQWAAYALGHLDGDVVVTRLRAYLNDPHHEVRQAAFKALGDASDHRAVPYLRVGLTDPHPGVRSKAAGALGDINALEAMDDLTTCLRDPHPDVRSEACWALGALGDSRPARLLVACLDDPHPRVSPAATWALGQVHGPDTTAALHRLLDSPHAQLRRRAVEALVKLDPEATTQSLLRGIDDRNSVVRAASAWALGRRPDSEAVDALLTRLDDPCADVRNEVANALGRSGDLRAVGPLLARLHEPAAWVRGRITVSLGQLGDPTAAEPLRRAAEDSDPWVYALAGWSLHALGETVAVHELRARLRCAAGVDRRVIVAVLSHLGDAYARRVLLAGLTASAAVTRRNWLAEFVWTLPDAIDRDLLSRDGDSQGPRLDPRAIVNRTLVGRMARNLRLDPAEVEGRYVRLARTIPLRLAISGDPAVE